MTQKPDRILILLLVLAAILLFTNLGNVYLWQDEAGTAMLGKNTLQFGFPRAFDGKNLVRNIYSDPCKYTPWKYEGWLQFYVTAAAFKVIGATTFAARLPFALFGLACVFMCYLLTQKVLKDQLASRLAATLLVFSLPFFLYMRQCRWYALVMFFTLSVMLSYINLLERRKLANIGLILSGVLLFHSNYGIFFPVFLGLGLHFIFFSKRNMAKGDIKRLISSLLMVGIFILPSLLYQGSTEYGGKMTLERTGNHLEFYFRVLNKYLFPCGFLFLNLTLFAFFRAKVAPLFKKSLNKSYLWLLICMFIAAFVFLVLPDERQLRYIMHLLPLSCIIMAILTVGCVQINKKVASLLFIIVCFTTLFHTGGPFRKKSWIPLKGMIYEITHDYDGPVEAIVRYLQENAKPSDTVKIAYGDLDLMFYTDLKVDNRNFKEKTFPEWIVPRAYWSPLKELDVRYRKQIEVKYEKIELDYADIKWENRPDPGYHKFRTFTRDKKVVIYKRK